MPLNRAEVFELVADLFYADTGHLRPGKSLPLEMCNVDNEEDRRTLFDMWTERNLVLLRIIYRYQESITAQDAQKRDTKAARPTKGTEDERE